MLTEKELASIGREIKIPESFLLVSLKHYSLLKDHYSFAEKLSVRGQAAEAFETLSKIIGSDPYGEKMFIFFLAAIAIAKEKYVSRGIDIEIFKNTMDIFGACIENCKKEEGSYKFDKGFWVYRQTSLSLFRIEALDFELYEGEDATCVALHIPLQGDLSKEAVDRSLEAFDALAVKAFPDFAKRNKTLYSWIIDPHIVALLPEGSRIRRFSERFEFKNRHDDLDEVFSWVFHCSPKDDFAKLPENTALQRNMKKALL
ncbi:MAG: acyltransferase domain-containing protein, partial [Bacilli bacterium]|nr:acyltransferase domain-containing protein [Bacilli bacterium]